MKKNILLLCVLVLSFSKLFSQDSAVAPLEVNFKNSNTYSGASYHTSFKKDAPVILLGVGLTYLGSSLIKNEQPLTTTELASKTINKIPFFDRGNAGYYSDKINKDSYIPFLASFVMPLAMVTLNKNESRNATKILVMYVESEAVTGALFTMAAGTIHRSRPLVYGTIAPDDQRKNKNNQRSFFAGHTAATASATFFAAKVFADLNPDCKAKPIVWAVAAAVPALVGYMRYKSGFHFLSDNLLGYVVGAASGILIPEWHKNKISKNISFTPLIGQGFKGISVACNFK